MMKAKVGVIVMSLPLAMAVANIPPRQAPSNATTTTPARSNVLNFRGVSMAQQRMDAARGENDECGTYWHSTLPSGFLVHRQFAACIASCAFRLMVGHTRSTV